MAHKPPPESVAGGALERVPDVPAKKSKKSDVPAKKSKK